MPRSRKYKVKRENIQEIIAETRYEMLYCQHTDRKGNVCGTVGAEAYITEKVGDPEGEFWQPVWRCKQHKPQKEVSFDGTEKVYPAPSRGRGG